jgi:hypothetical protein
MDPGSEIEMRDVIDKNKMKVRRDARLDGGQLISAFTRFAARLRATRSNVALPFVFADHGVVPFAPHVPAGAVPHRHREPVQLPGGLISHDILAVIYIYSSSIALCGDGVIRCADAVQG